MSATLRVRPCEAADGAAWDAYVQASPLSHFGQRIAWRDLTTRAYGVSARYWLAEEDGRVRGVLPLFRKRGRRPALFSAPGGLLADDEAVAAALLAPAREEVARERLAWLELRDQPRAWPDLETNREHLTMVLELTREPEGQWARFGAKLRNQIRKGEKAGYERRWGHANLAAFHRVMLENMRDLGTPLRGPAYYRLALELLGAAADLLVIEHAGDAAGAMFTVTHRDTLMDPWASSLRRHFVRCPNQVLYWEAIQRAIARGLRRFDFGRSQWGSPTFRFKEQWGAQPVPLHYQYVLGTAKRFPTLDDQKGSLDLATKLWKRLPLPLAALLGEPAKRLFPEVM
ncbi:MAG: GNAT family N-acetyltransferase [Candidatus Eisenbacteria bacterium]|nr:GNAT family N-acetyltransferase [Candidatus Eisenbacteria bacterium]